MARARAEITPEREAKGDLEEGFNSVGAKLSIWRLQKLYERGKIKGKHFIAGYEYRDAWVAIYSGGNIRSPDLDNVRSSDPSRFSHLARSEYEQEQKEKYRDARRHLGNDKANLLDNFLCHESLNEREIGRLEGWKGQPQQDAAGTTRIRGCLEDLCGIWKIK